MQIQSFFTYPVAGLQGFPVETLEMSEHEITKNRLFSVVSVDQIEKWLTQPDSTLPLRLTQVGVPQLVLLRAEETEGKLQLSSATSTIKTQLSLQLKTSSLPFLNSAKELPAPPQPALSDILRSYTIPLRVSNRSQSARWAVDCGDEVAEWLSAQLGKKCRLFQAVTSEQPKFHFTWYTELHLITQVSLNALAEEAQEEVTVAPFRPNIVIDGDVPFAEESWKELKIGKYLFDVSPCERCGYIGVDQETAARSHPRFITTVTQKHQGNFGVYLKPRKYPVILKSSDKISLR